MTTERDAMVAFHTCGQILNNLARADALLEATQRLAAENCRMAGIDPHSPDVSFTIAMELTRRSLREMETLSAEYQRRLVLMLRDPSDVAAEYDAEPDPV